MKIFIKTIKGILCTLDVETSGTVLDIKKQLEELEGIPTDQQRLIHRGIHLEDDRTLAHYFIKREDTLDLILKLRGD